MDLKKFVKNNLFLHYVCNKVLYEYPGRLLGRKWDILETKRKYRSTFGREIDFEHPETLNDKIIWLKLNVREDFHTICADKYGAREVWKQYGEDGLIPLLFQTYDWRDITYDVLPEEPCIVKCSTGCGYWEIIHDKSKVDIKKLRRECRLWLSVNYYYRSQEWQYKNIKPCIIIEKLLLDKNGRIPNDYKISFINGEPQFIYCSIDREGENYRNIYTPEWKRLDMEWMAPKKHHGVVGRDIPAPETLPQMLEIGRDIAKRFKYVRVDFYDVDGKLYYGEITLHHGSGFNTFVPESWDLYYGKKLVL